MSRLLQENVMKDEYLDGILSEVCKCIILFFYTGFYRLVQRNQKCGHILFLIDHQFEW